MPHISILVFGKVQQVFFRAYAKECADDLEIVGWVQNQQDGTVQIEAQHFNEDILKEFIEKIHEGSSLAVIDRVEVGWSEAEEFQEHFRILS